MIVNGLLCIVPLESEITVSGVLSACSAGLVIAVSKYCVVLWCSSHTIKYKIHKDT